MLQVFSGQRGAEAAAAVEDDFRGGVWNLLLDVALQDAFAEMNRAGKMILGVFAFLAHIEQVEAVAAVQAALDLIHRGLADALFGVADDLQKARRVFHAGIVNLRLGI